MPVDRFAPCTVVRTVPIQEWLHHKLRKLSAETGNSMASIMRTGIQTEVARLEKILGLSEADETASP